MFPVPISNKSSSQQYPAFSLPNHSNDTLQAAYMKKATLNARSVSVSATTSNYTPETMPTPNPNPYSFLTQRNSVKTLKSLCTTTPNLPTLLKASLEASLRGLSVSGRFFYFHFYFQIFFYIFYWDMIGLAEEGHFFANLWAKEATKKIRFKHFYL